MSSETKTGKGSSDKKMLTTQHEDDKKSNEQCDKKANKKQPDEMVLTVESCIQLLSAKTSMDDLMATCTLDDSQDGKPLTGGASWVSFPHILCSFDRFWTGLDKIDHFRWPISKVPDLSRVILHFIGYSPLGILLTFKTECLAICLIKPGYALFDPKRRDSIEGPQVRVFTGMGVLINHIEKIWPQNLNEKDEDHAVLTPLEITVVKRTSTPFEILPKLVANAESLSDEAEIETEKVQELELTGNIKETFPDSTQPKNNNLQEVQEVDNKPLVDGGADKLKMDVLVEAPTQEDENKPINTGFLSNQVVEGSKTEDLKPLEVEDSEGNTSYFSAQAQDEAKETPTVEDWKQPVPANLDDLEDIKKLLRNDEESKKKEEAPGEGGASSDSEREEDKSSSSAESAATEGTFLADFECCLCHKAQSHDLLFKHESCSHKFDRDCARARFLQVIEVGSMCPINAVKCPDDKCEAELPLSEAEAVLEPHESRLLRKQLLEAGAIHRINCPELGCTGVQFLTPHTQFHCPECGHSAFVFDDV